MVEQRNDSRAAVLGGGVSHPSQLTTGLVIKSVTTSPTLAGERMLFILQVSILSEQITFTQLLHTLSESQKHGSRPNMNPNSKITTPSEKTESGTVEGVCYF